MNLNISNLLNTLQGYYNPKKGTGEKYTGAEDGLNKFISAYGLSGAVTDENIDANSSKDIFFGGNKITVSSETANKFSYKIDEESGKIIIFGNNLTLTVDEGFSDLIEVVGISNVINATSNDDKITLIGYDNKVNADEGNDSVTVYGNDNVLKDSEINIFSGVSGQTLIYGEKTFEIGMKDSSADNSKIEISAEQTGEITINANNAKIIAQNDDADDITLNGDNNYLDVSAGADNIKVKGNKNIIVTGDDDGVDTVEIEGKENIVSGDNTDIITYKGKSGSINLTKADESSHYIEIEVSEGVFRKFYIEANSSDGEDVKISYSVNEDNQIVFTCNNAKIFAQDDTDEEIVVNGNNNYIDASAGNDKIIVNGDNNMIIPGDDDKSDEISINGNGNRVSGDSNDIVYYTGNSCTITLANDDNATHYIKVNGASYKIQRNPVYESEEDITVSYKLNSSGVFEISGDNFSITETNDIEDNIKITGNNNYIDVSSEDDNVTIIGDGNVLTAGDGDDSVIVIGKNNRISGDAGIDTIASSDESNITEDTFENVDKIVTLKSDNQAETVTTSDKKTYTLKLSPSAIKEEKEVYVVFRDRDGKVIIEADNIVVEAGKGQEDDITFKGSSSKIFAADKNDVINVIGDNNDVDGWSGDDKITVVGRNNQAYGFLGDDEITIIQRESMEAEISDEVKNVADTDDNGNTRTDAEKQVIAQDNLAQSGANQVDGEFGTDTVYANSSSFEKSSIYKYTKVSEATEINTSPTQAVRLAPSDDEKRIILTDDAGKTYSYTIKNHVSSNNPFVGTRTIRYDFVDITDENGNTKKQLVVQGDYIEVVADEAQEDNVQIIGDGNRIDLGDEMDYLEAQGNYNLIFVGKGNDFVRATGDKNEIYADKGDDEIIVNGSGNKVSGGEGNDILKLYGDSFEAFGDDGDDIFDVSAINSKLYGGSGVNTVSSTINGIETNTFKDFENDPTPKTGEDLLILSPTNLKDTISIAGLTFDVKPNIKNLAGNIYISYKLQTDENGEPQLLIKGNTFIMNLDKSDAGVNVKIVGDDIAFYSYAGNDKIEIVGNKNKIDAGKGENTVIVKGNNNTVACGRSINDVDDTSVNNIIVNGNYNTVENINNNDNISMTGINNNKKSLYDGERNGGSFVLTKESSKQTLVMKDRAYEFTVYGIAEDKIADTEINVRYDVDDEGYVHFYADNVKIRVIDDESTKNGVSAVLHGNNCCVTGGHGQDNLIIYGNHNLIDGWYGNDSFAIEGSDNDIRGYDGDDNITIVRGDRNEINGEQGQDTLTIIEGNSNKYENIENIKK